MGTGSVKGSARSGILLLLGTVVVVFLIGEWAMFAIRPQNTMTRLLESTPRIFHESDLLPYELEPNSESSHIRPEFSVPIRINSRGYRWREFEEDKGDRFRILVLGDSFTFGHGCAIEDCYPSVLEDALSERLGNDRVEVINAGYASGNYPDTYYLYLKELGVRLRPDLVVIGFFIGNDIDRQGRVHHEWPRVDDEGLPLRIVDPVAHVRDGYWVSKAMSLRYRFPVIRESHLCQAIFTVIARSFKVGVSSKPVYNELVFLPEYPERTTEAWERVRRLLAATEDVAEENGARLMILMIPAREQVEPDAFFPEEMLFSNALDLEKPQRLLAAHCEEAGTEYVDLLPAARAMPDRADLYFMGDQHWTEAGHALAGTAIAEQVLASTPGLQE